MWCVCLFVIYLRKKSPASIDDDDGILLVHLSDKSNIQRLWKRRNMVTRNKTTKIARLVRRDPIVCVCVCMCVCVGG